jgi:uncharacterized protein CbrC (UPF0167 family)
MFLGFYMLDGKEHFNIYCKSRGGYEEWHRDTFSPTCEDIAILDFKIGGKTYQERKNNLEELAKDWQHNWSYLSWSYFELYEIQNYFLENGKRYGLLREFHENAIC